MQKMHNNLTVRPKKLPGMTEKKLCACGDIFVTVNYLDSKIFEVFIRLGKAGGCAMALNESIGKLISHFLQEGGDVQTVLKSLSGVSCHQASATVPSCVSAVAEVLKEHINQTTKKGE